MKERGDAMPGHPQPSQCEMTFQPAQQSIIWDQLTPGRVGGLSGSCFVLPDSLQEQSDSLLRRCAASGSSKDRDAGRWGGERRLGLRCQKSVLHLPPGS